MPVAVTEKDLATWSSELTAYGLDGGSDVEKRCFPFFLCALGNKNRGRCVIFVEIRFDAV